MIEKGILKALTLLLFSFPYLHQFLLYILGNLIFLGFLHIQIVIFLLEGGRWGSVPDIPLAPPLFTHEHKVIIIERVCDSFKGFLKPFKKTF